MIELSESHLATDHYEIGRIQKLGSMIVDGRIKGLSITRAFGDLSLASNGLIAVPSM